MVHLVEKFSGVLDFSGVMDGENMYECIAAAPNGELFYTPSDVDRVLEIDPEAGTVTKISEVLDGDGKYGCIACASSGKLYAVPYCTLRCWR